jgi:hypothetical protein
MITADPGSHERGTPKSMKLSPVKKVLETPNKGELLDSTLLKRLPYVCPLCLSWHARPIEKHLMSSVHIKHIFHKKLVLMKTNNPRAFKKEIKRLTLLGRRRNNLRGFTKKDRPIIPAYRRSGKSPTEGRILCQFCWTSITLRAYESTHGETCKRQSGVDDKLTPKQQKILLAVKQPIFETEDEQMEQLLAKWPSVFREVFFDMHLDRLKLTQFCLKEEVARRLVLSHIKDKSGSVTKISRTRSMIRMLYGMLSFFREIRSNSELTIEEAMDYDNWHCHTFDQNVHDIVACCNKVCGRIKKGTK